MSDRLSPSEWTVPEARRMAAQLRQVASSETEYDDYGNTTLEAISTTGASLLRP